MMPTKFEDLPANQILNILNTLTVVSKSMNVKMKLIIVARLNFALIRPKVLIVAAGQVIEEILIQTNASPKSFVPMETAGHSTR